MDALALSAKEALEGNRADAISFVQTSGVRRTRELLQGAAGDLKKKIAAKVKSGHGETFTLAQMRTTLAQVQDSLKFVVRGMHDTILDVGDDAAQQSAEHTIEYLKKVDRAFRGIGTSPLPIREASMLDEATQGVRSSILRRLASSGEPIEGADEEPSPAKLGVLERYGVETIDHFEGEMRKGLVAKKSWGEMQDSLIERSPFLQGAPAHWAERIVRTEVMGAYARSSWETIREADDQFGDMTKFLCATFDDRTGADSYVVHGQCRRPEQAFASWYGFFQHPPARPNDREVVVPHRISWPRPPYLFPMPRSAAQLRWRMQGNKKPMPPTPLITTVSFALFGKKEPPKLDNP